MKVFFSNYGFISYIDKQAYINSPNMQYCETFFREHAAAGYVSEIPFKLFGINSIDVVYNYIEDRYYFTFLYWGGAYNDRYRNSQRRKNLPGR